MLSIHYLLRETDTTFLKQDKLKERFLLSCVDMSQQCVQVTKKANSSLASQNQKYSGQQNWRSDSPPVISSGKATTWIQYSVLGFLLKDAYWVAGIYSEKCNEAGEWTRKEDWWGVAEGYEVVQYGGDWGKTSTLSLTTWLDRL